MSRGSMMRVIFRGRHSIWWSWSVTFCGRRSIWWSWNYVIFRGRRSIWWAWSVTLCGRRSIRWNLGRQPDREMLQFSRWLHVGKNLTPRVRARCCELAENLPWLSPNLIAQFTHRRELESDSPCAGMLLWAVRIKSYITWSEPEIVQITRNR